MYEKICLKLAENTWVRTREVIPSMNTKRALKVKTKCWALQCFVAIVDWILAFFLFWLFFSGYNTSFSSSWSSSFCLLFMAFRLCCLFGSKASTTICSVPLISALQNGQPWNETHAISTFSMTSTVDLLVPRNRLAKRWDMAYTANARTAQFWCLYHSRHIFYTIGRCFL